MFRTTTIAILCSLVTVTAYAQPYKIFITTQVAQFVDEDAKARLDSVADMKKAIAEKKYDKTFVLVENADNADLVLDVLSRGEVESGQRQGSITSLVRGTATSQSEEVMQNSLRVQLTVGDYRTDFYGVKPGEKNLFGPQQRNWRQQAGEVLEQLNKWCRENTAQLSAR